MAACTHCVHRLRTSELSLGRCCHCRRIVGDVVSDGRTGHWAQHDLGTPCVCAPTPPLHDALPMDAGPREDAKDAAVPSA